jgi:hypothetical protein
VDYVTINDMVLSSAKMFGIGTALRSLQKRLDACPQKVGARGLY